MTTSNKKMKQQQLGSTTGKKKNNKVCTFENFVSEGMETIGETNHQVVKQKGSIDNVSFADGSSTNATRTYHFDSSSKSHDATVQSTKSRTSSHSTTHHSNAVQLTEPSKLLPTSNKSLMTKFPTMLEPTNCKQTYTIFTSSHLLTHTRHQAFVQPI
jgi:hypothetical protein